MPAAKPYWRTFLPKLAIYLFGAPRVELDGKPLVTDTRKATALLAYLAVTRQAHTRDTLATLLWPELDQTRARAALRRTLSALNAAAALPWLHVEREQVALALDDDLYCDVHAFERCLADCPPTGAMPSEPCRAHLAEAAGIQHGDFLAGFTLRDSAAFDDWQFFQAEGYRHNLARLLETLVRCASDAQEWAAAIDYARRWLAIDPLHEPAHRQLMQLYAFDRQRSAAIRQYQECVRILDEELGVPPLAETMALHEAILNRELVLPGRAESPPQGLRAAPVAVQSPLVERESAWTALQNACARAADHGQLIVVEGEAGIGKTALAAAFAAEYARQGASVITVSCFEGETALAYAPLATLLQQAAAKPDSRERLAGLDRAWLAEVGRLQPSLLALHAHDLDVRGADPFVAQSRFFEGIAQAIDILLAGGQPGLLILDDIHNADNATLDWLNYFVRRLAVHHLSVMLIWRDGDTPADHRLRQLAGQCERQGNATLITLERLSPAAVVRWVVQALEGAGADTEELARRLFAESEGLPFIVAEYLNLLAGASPLLPDATWPAPGRVQEFLLARLAPLTDIARQVLSAAAVIGRSFDIDTVTDVSGRGEEETMSALEELLARRLVTESGADQLDFSYARLRQVVYGDLSHLRRRLLHRRAGDALAAAARRGSSEEEIAGLLAYHYQLGGEHAKAAHHAFAAGERARRVYANREAIGYFEQALALGADDICGARIHLGDLHTLMGEYSRAEEAYSAALTCCPPAQRADLEHRLGRLCARLGDTRAATAHFAASQSLLASDEVLQRAELLIDWSLALARTQDDAATDLAQQALAAAEAVGDVAQLARSQALLALLARRRSGLDAAREAGEAGVAAARRQQDPAVLVAALNSLALVYAERGDHTTAIELIEEALSHALRIGDRHREAALRNTLADLHHACGQTEQAMAQLKQAVVIFAEIGDDLGGENAEIWMLREW